MSTHKNTWKAAERRVAGHFGALRQRLSGSSGRDDMSSSDSTHERLYIEVKYRATHAARSLYEDTKSKAKKEGKVPVVALFDKGRPGFLLCLHIDDLQAIAAEAVGATHEEGERQEHDMVVRDFGRLLGPGGNQDGHSRAAD